MIYEQPQMVKPTQQRPPATTRASDRYLPAMPEMLKASNPPAAGSQRYAQNPPAGKSAPGVKPGELLVRGQGHDEAPSKSSPSPARLSMPSPEELGLLPGNSSSPPTARLGSPSTGPSAWAAASDRLDRLGATYYRLEKAPEGGFRFSCALPYPQNPSQQRQFEVRAQSEDEAIRSAMRQVEEWKVTVR